VEHDAAEAHYRRSLAAYEPLPDPHGSVIAQHNLGPGHRFDVASSGWTSSILSTHPPDSSTETKDSQIQGLPVAVTNRFVVVGSTRQLQFPPSLRRTPM
jgi:hypothetical protein